MTGRGGGLTDAAFEKKKDIIRRALALHGLVGTASGLASGDAGAQFDPIEVLSRVGGLDLAGMCGLFLGAAICRIPAVIDGYISAVAALCAYRLAPAARAYFIPSHCSAEPGYTCAMEAMQLRPVLMLGMRLGEGSGCPLMFRIVEAACALMTQMATFRQADINDEYLAGLRGQGTPS